MTTVTGLPLPWGPSGGLGWLREAVLGLGCEDGQELIRGKEGATGEGQWVAACGREGAELRGLREGPSPRSLPEGVAGHRWFKVTGFVGLILSTICLETCCVTFNYVTLQTHLRC